MLPRTTHLLAVLSFLAELGVSSPVYNMQPAYITATIGSTGRNIRNLPCISRKSSQSGVCMFAIDCLKANGTHLGTCIDRFYFGSCCHIEPLQDITENTIDAALIPSREPPHRITTTSAPTTIVVTSATNTTQEQEPGVITTAIVQTTMEASPAAPSVTLDDSEAYKITTFQSVDEVPVTTTLRPSSAKPKPAKTKPTNKPTVAAAQTVKTTAKVTKPRPQTTPKPSPTYINRNTTQQLNATRPHTITPRPRPKPTKPIKITKPFVNATVTTTTASPTTLNVHPTTVPLSTTTSSTKLTRKPSVVTKGTPTTRKPVVTTTSKLPVTVTTTELSTATIKTTTKLTTAPTTSATSTSTLSNEVLVAVNTSLADAQKQPEANVNGNPATNEIESPPDGTTTSVPSLVTWSEINKNQTHTVNVTTSQPVAPITNTEDVTNPDDWVPVTDGWVLLPSLTTTQESNDNGNATPSSTDKSEEANTAAGDIGSTEANSATPSPSTTSAQQLTSSTESEATSSSPTSSTGHAPSSSSTEDASVSSSATSSTSADTAVSATPTPVTTSGLNMSDFTDVCGRRMVPEGRIVGGEKSAFGKWPWQISLRQWRTSTYLHKCGAALLNENWAITAAHCVDNVPPSDLLLRLGEHDLSTEAEPYLHQERRVQIVASHPQFDPRTFEYDLALLRFYEPVTFQPNIIPVCVPNTDENFVGRNAHVTGWGRLYEDGPLPSVLQEVSVPVINNTVCESMYRSAGYIEHIPNIFICAGWRRGGFDSCEGDSGGPMVIQRPDKRFILAGVISWGIGCAEPNQPGVYTRISEFRDWINQILQF